MKKILIILTVLASLVLCSCEPPVSVVNVPNTSNTTSSSTNNDTDNTKPNEGENEDDVINTDDTKSFNDISIDDIVKSMGGIEVVSIITNTDSVKSFYVNHTFDEKTGEIDDTKNIIQNMYNNNSILISEIEIKQNSITVRK